MNATTAAAGAGAGLDVDVIIVAHNSGELLRAAVASAAKQAGESRVWIADAESTDGSTEGIAGEFPATHVVAVPNEGFSASNNRLIERTHGAYVMLLNPDAELCDGALRQLVATATEQPRAAVVAPLILNPDGSPQAESRGRYPSLHRALGYRLWREWQKLRGNERFSPRVPKHVASTPWATGAAMLVRRSAIEKVGMLDEDFFLYLEDVDWCRRMHAERWDVLVDPAACAYHHVRMSGVGEDVLSDAYIDALMHYCDKYGLRTFKAVMRRRFDAQKRDAAERDATEPDSTSRGAAR